MLWNCGMRANFRVYRWAGKGVKKSGRLDLREDSGPRFVRANWTIWAHNQLVKLAAALLVADKRSSAMKSTFPVWAGAALTIIVPAWLLTVPLSAQQQGHGHGHVQLDLEPTRLQELLTRSTAERPS